MTTPPYRLQDENSKPIPLQRGVRQGDVISPKLFAAALEDVFKTGEGCYNTPSYDHRTETNHDQHDLVEGTSEHSQGVIPDPVVAPDVVVFPGRSRRDTPFVPSIPEECLRTGICEELPDYPEDYVATIIEKLGNATEKFKVDELDTFEIAQRIGSPEEIELCDFIYKIAVPKAAPDKDGIWHYIINLKEKHLQGSRVEMCKKAGSACSRLAYFYSSYEASCQQKFMFRPMAGLDYNGEVIQKQFKLPSCCSCVVRQKH